MKSHFEIYSHGTSLQLRRFIALALVMVVAALLPLTAEAATYTDVEGFETYLKYEYSNNKGDSYGSASQTAGTGSVAITIGANPVPQSTVFGTAYRSSTTTFTLHNKQNYPISVTFTLSNVSSSSGSSPLEIPALGTVVFTVSTGGYDYTASSGSGTLTITGCEAVQTPYNTTFATGLNGSYTVTHEDHASISVDGTTPYSSVPTKAYTLTPSANEGYTFYGWADSTGLLSLTKSADGTQYTYVGEKDNTIWPVFRKSGAAMYYIEGAPGVFYDSLDLANTAALGSTSKKIVVCGSGNVIDSQARTSITISDGITLLIPYSASDLTIMPGTSGTNDFKYANVAFASVYVATEAAIDPTADVYLKLSIPNGTTVNVGEDDNDTQGGLIVVGGTIVASEGNSVFEGLCYGAHSNLEVENGANLNLGSYSVLSAVGYVLGGGTITTTGTGAELYQPFVLHDWRGGRHAIPFIDLSDKTSSLATYDTLISPIQSGESLVSPFLHWGTFNIRPKTEIAYGNFMYGYASLLDGDFYTSYPILVGTTSGVILLSEGATLTSEYKDIVWGTYPSGYPGKNEITIQGGASLGTMQMGGTVSGIDVDINTANFTLTIAYCYSITLQSGQYYVDNPMALLPGASITVDSSATLKLGTQASSPVRIAVLSGHNDQYKYNVYAIPNHNYNSANDISATYKANTRENDKSYATTAELQGAKINNTPMSGDAELIVNGTLVIGANASFGGLIQTTGTNGTIDATAGTAGEVPTSVIQLGLAGHKAFEATKVFQGCNYYAGMSLHTNTARMVSAADGSIVDVVRGNTYYGNTKESTLETYSYKLYTSSADPEAYTDVVHPLNETIYGKWCAHSYDATVTDPTCTEQGYTTHTCSICGNSYKDTYVDANGHSYESVVTVPTCTAKGYTTHTCTACGNSYVDTYVDANGHKYESVITNPTCTEAGSTTYTCSVCGDSYSEPIAATGHNYESVETKPTCTMPGYTTYTCRQKDHSYVELGDPATGHSYDPETGKCTCGATKPNVTFEVKHNLNLLDLIKIGYWIKAESETIDLTNATYGIKVWKLGEVEPDTSDLKLKKRNGYMQVYGDGIYAQELDTVYCARPFVTVDGTTYASDVVDIFSVPMYAENAFAEGSGQSDIVKNAVRDLLNYATDAQFYFLIRNEGYTEETLKNRTPINSVLGEELRTTRYEESMQVTAPEITTNTDGTLTASWAKSSINLEEAISLNLFWQDCSADAIMLYWDETKYKEAESLTYDNKTGEVSLAEKGSYQVGKIAPIYAKDIGDFFYACVYSGEAYSKVAVDSVAAYLTRGIEASVNGKLDMTLLENQYMIATFKDMLAYGNSAYAYAQTINPIV